MNASSIYSHITQSPVLILVVKCLSLCYHELATMFHAASRTCPRSKVLVAHAQWAIPGLLHSVRMLQSTYELAGSSGGVSCIRKR